MKQLYISAMTPNPIDLFGYPALPGVETCLDHVQYDAETVLANEIDRLDLAPFRFQQWTGKRLTTSFGWRYDFENGGFARAEPIPDWLLPVRDSAARFARLAPDALEQVLLTRYDPGAGIGWHRDRPVFDHVVGISLGAAATLRFRRRKPTGDFDRRSIDLPPRSAYHLSGEARWDWEHSIAPMAKTRWSITFRSLRAVTQVG
jgi:DNA oxidative demethylase